MGIVSVAALRGIFLGGLFAVLLGLSAGCASAGSKADRARGDEAIWAPINTLCTHPRAVVRYPSDAGAFVGGVAAVPVALALAPVTVPLARCDRGRGANLLPLAPLFLGAQGGAVALGGPFWLVFGWWGEPNEGDRG